MPLPIAALGALTAGVSSIGQTIAGSISNRKNRKFASEMFEREKQRDIDFWNMTNAYNSPEAQMQRLKDAGLNPNLVYGNGADAQAAPLKGGSAPSYTNRPVPVDFTNIAQTAIGLRQVEANISRTEAETEAIKSRTELTEFDNQVNRLRDVEQVALRYRQVDSALTTKASYEVSEINAYWAAGFTERGEMVSAMSHKSPLAKAIRAGLEKAEVELNNAKKLGDIRRFETVIKQFESNLTKEGFSPNSPWYIKFIGDLIRQTGIPMGSGSTISNADKDFRSIMGMSGEKY